jgi:putative membrane protein
MKPILTTDERDKIAALVAEIERHTASELVTVVYSKSAPYTAFRIGWAAGIALGLVGLASLLSSRLTALELIGVQSLLAIIVYWSLGFSLLLRLIVPRWAKQQAVHDKVRQLFLELGVTETRDRSGVLIYLSELERRVEILGDRGIHEQLGTDAWNQLVLELTAAIRGGNAYSGLTRIVERLGAELSAKFPIRPDDVNELPNTVVTDQR